MIRPWLNALLVGFLLLMTGTIVAQTQLTFKLERAQGVSAKSIKRHVQEKSGLRDVQVEGDQLTIQIPAESVVTVPRIREILAEIQVAAVSVEEVTGATRAKSQKLQTVSFSVAGNCAMCQQRIERAAKSVSGVLVANWDVDSQVLTLKMRSTTEVGKVHEAVARAGHDTSERRADDSVYENLHHCCKYDRLESEVK